VHNGIIENFQELRAKCDPSCKFESETDTEVLVHTMSAALDEHGNNPEKALCEMLKKIEGAFSFVVLLRDFPEKMLGARRGNPLTIGYGDGEMFFGSDALSLSGVTQRLCHLEDGDWASLSCDGAVIYDGDMRPQNRAIIQSQLSGAIIGKGAFRHFMEKEIHEQPELLGQLFNTMLNPADRRIVLPELPNDVLDKISHITITACGTAFLAASVARYWLEQYVKIPVDIDIASEWRYRSPALRGEGALLIAISQSGETMDTLQAVRFAKQCGRPVLSVLNVVESTIARESDAVLETNAGPEIGVASTKGFTTQLMTLACLTIALGRRRGVMDRETEQRFCSSLSEVPGLIAGVLNREAEIENMAMSLQDSHSVLYMGRGTGFPIALEGALKLKELSYIHAEGYPAGEMKHGPIALIDKAMKVIFLMQGDELADKIVSNIREVASRGASILLFAEKKQVDIVCGQLSGVEAFIMPPSHDFACPILYTVPVQLLAYHTARIKGTDVDQPRNLAKSVTVE
jgi:glucosamine--fructose-6-phosphate aminotransferase (isomerizing)